MSIFTGQADGVNTDQARQVLRSGGNVLSTFLYDENGDGLKDLWLWRVESISVGDIFVWLALSGSIAIDAFIYANNGERFERRPARKVTVDLKFPSVASGECLSDSEQRGGNTSSGWRNTHRHSSPRQSARRQRPISTDERSDQNPAEHY